MCLADFDTYNLFVTHYTTVEIKMYVELSVDIYTKILNLKWLYMRLLPQIDVFQRCFFVDLSYLILI